MGRIVYCRCAFADVVPSEVKDEVLRGLCAAGVSFECVPDLCEMSARKDPRLETLLDGGPLKVAACYPRAVRWLLRAAGSGLAEGEEGLRVLNMREQGAAEVLGELLRNDEKA